MLKNIILVGKGRQTGDWKKMQKETAFDYLEKLGARVESHSSEEKHNPGRNKEGISQKGGFWVSIEDLWRAVVIERSLEAL